MGFLAAWGRLIAGFVQVNGTFGGLQQSPPKDPIHFFVELCCCDKAQWPQCLYLTHTNFVCNRHVVWSNAIWMLQVRSCLVVTRAINTNW